MIELSEWLSNKKQSKSNVGKLLQERIEKSAPRRKLSAEETKRLAKLEAIADKLKRGDNVQNRQLQTWLSEDEYAQLDAEWQEQLGSVQDIQSTFVDFQQYLYAAKGN